MKIGYDRFRQAVVIPWFDTNGRLANIKYRKTHGKVFWYEKDAVPIRKLIYGANVIYKRKITEVYLVEAEIDAMSLWTLGKPAIAVGGASFTNEQADIIKRSPIEALYICGDNDRAGDKLRKLVSEKLEGYVNIINVRVSSEYKDVNEALKQENAINFKKVETYRMFFRIY
ncbi:toprim domain-containing protein [Bacillus cytotoxicus]|uniref:toprim domain-containing protein n=1 Tax=Bacillus cytotoxicus TaxID=580165 RepID=UPI003D7C4A85